MTHRNGSDARSEVRWTVTLSSKLLGRNARNVHFNIDAMPASGCADRLDFAGRAIFAAGLAATNVAAAHAAVRMPKSQKHPVHSSAWARKPNSDSMKKG